MLVSIDAPVAKDEAAVEGIVASVTASEALIVNFVAS